MEQLNSIIAQFRTLRKQQLLLLHRLLLKHHKKRKSIDKAKRRLWSIHSPETLNILTEESPTSIQVPQLIKVRKKSKCKLRSIPKNPPTKSFRNSKRKVRNNLRRQKRRRRKQKRKRRSQRRRLKRSRRKRKKKGKRR